MSRLSRAQLTAAAGLVVAVLLSLVGPGDIGAAASTSDGRVAVAPIHEGVLDSRAAYDSPLGPLLRRTLSGSASYLLKVWLPAQGWDLDGGDNYVMPVNDANVTRGASSVALAFAITARTGAYLDWHLPPGELIQDAVRIVGGLAEQHVANGGSWGDSWSSALDSSYAGLAAWLVWSHLSPTQQQNVASMLVSEADTQTTDQVQYFQAVQNADGSPGAVLIPGDTKEEELSWDSRVLSLAGQMFPSNPHAPSWLSQFVAETIGSGATQADTRSTTGVNGSPLCHWLGGSNVNDDGTAINHSIINPPYMATPHTFAAGFQALLGSGSVPDGAFNGLGRLYAAFTRDDFPSDGDYSITNLPGTTWQTVAPGGEIYQTGSAGEQWQTDIYYPQNGQSGPANRVKYLANDVEAAVFGADPTGTAMAEARHHLDDVAAQQARFSDGHIYLDDSEFDSPLRETDAGERLAQTWLTLVTTSNRALTKDDSTVAVPATVTGQTC